MISRKVEQYLFMNESYRSDNDPDYEIGETTCDFEESTGESATDEESVDTKGFLCEKCREDCDDNCEENRKEDFKEDAKNTMKNLMAPWRLMMRRNVIGKETVQTTLMSILTLWRK